MVNTVAHSRTYACSNNSWNTTSFRLFMETFCSPRIISIITNINVWCLYMEDEQSSLISISLTSTDTRKIMQLMSAVDLSSTDTLVDIAASKTVHLSSLWKGPAAWTTKSAPGKGYSRVNIGISKM